MAQILPGRRKRGKRGGCPVTDVDRDATFGRRPWGDGYRYPGLAHSSPLEGHTMTYPQQPNWSDPSGQPASPASPGYQGGWSDPTGQPQPANPAAPASPAYPGAPASPAYPGAPDPTTSAAATYQYAAQPYSAQPYGQPAYGQPVYVGRPNNGMAIAALVCSLAGLLTIITAPIGAILGHIARKQIRESGEQGDGMALAGIIVGWIITGLWVCGCVGYIALVASIIGTGAANT
jgi:hypothetical protein